MTRKRALLTLGAVGLTLILIFSIGISMLTNSGAYVEAQTQVNNQLNANRALTSDTVRLAWWKSWSYNESNLEGEAIFSVCQHGTSGKRACYLVQMKKERGKWKLLSMQGHE
jgi:hypothetical protein